MRNTVVLLIGLAFVASSCFKKENHIYLKPVDDGCTEKLYSLPSKVSVTYRGFELGAADLIDESGLYLVTLKEDSYGPVHDTPVNLKAVNLQRTKYTIEFDSIATSSEWENDTLVFSCSNLHDVGERIERIGNDVIQKMDSLGFFKVDSVRSNVSNASN